MVCEEVTSPCVVVCVCLFSSLMHYPRAFKAEKPLVHIHPAKPTRTVGKTRRGTWQLQHQNVFVEFFL